VHPWTDKVGGIVAAQVCAIRFAQRGLEGGRRQANPCPSLKQQRALFSGLPRGMFSGVP
jgi:hypothetical protein